MSFACVKWFVRECTHVREGMLSLLHFRTAPGRCVSLLAILPVMVSVRVVVCGPRSLLVISEPQSAENSGSTVSKPLSW